MGKPMKDEELIEIMKVVEGILKAGQLDAEDIDLLNPDLIKQNIQEAPPSASTGQKSGQNGNTADRLTDLLIAFKRYSEEEEADLNGQTKLRDPSDSTKN